MSAAPRYVVAGVRPWNRRLFDERLARLPGEWHFAGDRHELSSASLAELKPRYVFFLHWSWIVPDDIVAEHECVAFHMTDLPFGRGGSPLQNLIVRGIRQTKLCAFRMVPELDAGPVYMRAALALEGSAEEIYLRANSLAGDMVERIVQETPVPSPQQGDVVTFKRRTPRESAIPPSASLEALYDFVRMLDAEGYPRAFLEHGGFRYELSRAALRDGQIVADVVIRPVEQ